MSTVRVRGGRLFDPASGLDLVGDLLVRDGVVVEVGAAGPPGAARGVAVARDEEVLDATGLVVVPAFTDLHVHFREPGGEASETIATGTAAAIAGGFERVFAMPNTDPVCDRPEGVARVLAAARAAGPCDVAPVSAITVGLRGRELVDFDAQAAAGARAFSDDGRWVERDDLAEEAFERAARGGHLLMQHCEDLCATGTGVAHDAPAVRAAGLSPIARRAEDDATARDLVLARRHGTRLHLCHVSTRGALDLLARARAEGLPVSGEATPHHLTLTVEDAVRGGVDFKMKPPLREADDVAALVAALADGTIAAIGTDHAPHAPASKSVGWERAPFGAIGVETAFPVLFTRLVEPGRVSLARLVDALTAAPARIARAPAAALSVGAPARFVLLDLATPRRVDREALRSKSRNCPFHGALLRGWPVATVLGTAVARDLAPPPA